LYLRGPTSKGKEGEAEERREREGEGREGEERGRTTLHTPVANSWLRQFSIHMLTASIGVTTFEFLDKLYRS